MTDARSLSGTLDAGVVERVPRLRAFLRRLGAARGDLDDLVQDALARAWRFRASYDPERPLDPWLQRIALRVWLDQTKAASRRPETLGDRDAAVVSRRLHDSTAAESLARLFGRLRRVEHDVLVRFHRDGQSLAEIAAALRLPIGTVKSHLHRARHRLVEKAKKA